MAISAVNGVFKAIIVDTIDPENMGRVKVRIPVIHGALNPSAVYSLIGSLKIATSYTPDSQLPWAEVMFPVTAESGTTISTSIYTGLIVNVIGVGSSLSTPIVVGSTGNIYGQLNNTSGNNTSVSTSTDPYAGISVTGTKTAETGKVLAVPGDRKVLSLGQHKVTSPFGPRWGTNHGGIDLVALTPYPCADNIVAFADGTVEIKKLSDSYGNYVMLKHSGNYKTVYAHMKSFADGIKVGGKVTRGQMLGVMGNTGNVVSSKPKSSGGGTHLHFEVRYLNTRVDPAPFLIGQKSFT